MNLTKLMSLAEASGFAGGSAGYVDEYPSMSLSECTAALPMFIMESQANGFDETRRHNDLIVEDGIPVFPCYKAYAIVFDLPDTAKESVVVNG